MINEKDIIRQEEIDFRKIVHRFFRGWPLILLCLGIWLVIGVAFQVSFPAWYTAKTTILIEKPKGLQDPSVMLTRMPSFVRPDDYYYNNQKVAVRSYPLVYRAAQASGMQLAYIKKGLLFDTELYSSSPISVEIDTVFMPMTRHETPYGSKFYVSIKENNTYEVEAEGEYPVIKKEFEFGGTFRFGEWVAFDKTRFRVTLRDTIANPAITLQSSIADDVFGFVIRDLNAVTIDFMSSMTIEAEDVEATVFGVALTGSVPELQRNFLTHLMEVYTSDQLRVKTDAVDKAIEYLNDELVQLRSELTFSEDEIQVFKTENSITNLSREGTLLVEENMKLENEKVSFLLKEKYYEYLMRYLDESDNYSGLISPAAFGIKDQLLGKLTEDLVKLQFEKNAIARTGNETNPIFKQIEAKIENHKQTIKSTVGGFQQSNRMMVDNVEKRLRDIDNTARSLPRIQQQLLSMERIHRINETLYTSLMDKKSEAEITRISTSPDVRIIEPPFITSIDPIFPKTIITFAAAILLGLLVGFGWILVRSILNNRLDITGDITRYAYNIPSIGKFMNTNVLKPADLVAYPDSQAGEELGSILYALYQNRSGQGKVFSVASYGHGEGKTTFTSLLATKAGLLGYKVLCVDFNLRNPNLHHAFKVSNTTGMTDYFSGAMEAGTLIQGTGIAGVEIITAGAAKQGYSLNRKKITALFELLSQSYDMIFVDTSPFGRVSDTFSVMDQSAHNIIIARRKKTAYGDLQSINDMATNNIISNASIVATDVFSEDFSLMIFKGSQDKYYRNKPLNLTQRVKRLLLRV